MRLRPVELYSSRPFCEGACRERIERILFRLNPSILILSFMISPSLASPPPFGFEIYAPAHTVSEFCQDDAGLVKVTGVLKAANVSKIYLETYRSGHRVEESILITARDRLRAAGFEVATGITTTPGGGQGVASNGNSYFFNYESQETRDLLKSLFEFMATHFDEIMVDDFFLTDDTSEVSVEAKKDRTWSEYRLALMTEVAEKWAVGPARKINPKVIVTLKYPQWYDRFQVYGYNVETGPKIFDQIWVGAETRNPDTARFGFTQPTMGYNNFRWLASLGGDKVQGAWFDPLDCHEDVYLMQAYQSVLAKARRLTLFNLSDYMGEDPVLEKFKRRQNAVTQLAGIVDNRKPLGMAAYKPPHSNPGRDAYLFDFLSVLGLPLVPVGRIEELGQYPSILLSGHAKGDPNLIRELHQIADLPSKVFLWTPEFAPDHVLVETAESSQITVLGQGCESDRKFRFLKIHPPKESRTLASAMSEGEEIPVLVEDRIPSGLAGLLLNVFTYSYNDFEKVDEMFLPPHPSEIPFWPKELADAVREEVSLPLPLHISADPPFGLNFYEGEILVVSNFGGGIKEAVLRIEGASGEAFLHPGFDHAEGVYLGDKQGSKQRLRLPSWEIAVLQFDGIREDSAILLDP